VFRQLFALAIGEGIIRASDNPIIGIKNVPVPPGDCEIPTEEEMIALRDEVYRRSQAAGIMLDFLVFSGSRIKAALKVTWGDVDWVSGTINFKHTKRKSYRVTILPEMHSLLKRLAGRRTVQIERQDFEKRGRCAKPWNRQSTT